MKLQMAFLPLLSKFKNHALLLSHLTMFILIAHWSGLETHYLYLPKCIQMSGIWDGIYTKILIPSSTTPTLTPILIQIVIIIPEMKYTSQPMTSGILILIFIADMSMRNTFTTPFAIITKRRLTLSVCGIQFLRGLPRGFQGSLFHRMLFLWILLRFRRWCDLLSHGKLIT